MQDRHLLTDPGLDVRAGCWGCAGFWYTSDKLDNFALIISVVKMTLCLVAASCNTIEKGVQGGWFSRAIRSAGPANDSVGFSWWTRTCRCAIHKGFFSFILAPAAFFPSIFPKCCRIINKGVLCVHHPKTVTCHVCVEKAKTWNVSIQPQSNVPARLLWFRRQPARASPRLPWDAAAQRHTAQPCKQDFNSRRQNEIIFTPSPFFFFLSHR